jgi:putative phosphoesterase
MTTVGLIADTHSLLRPQAIAALQGVDLIVHAGDIGSLAVMDGLSAIAPVRAVRGNIDTATWAQQFPADDVIEIAGKSLYVLHNRHDLAPDPAATGFDVVISGHSHKPGIDRVGGVLFVNPGSAGPRRFTLPIAIATLRITPHAIEAEIQELVA